jgi:hypothetical protein
MVERGKTVSPIDPIRAIGAEERCYQLPAAVFLNGAHGNGEWQLPPSE